VLLNHTYSTAAYGDVTQSFTVTVTIGIGLTHDGVHADLAGDCLGA